MMAKKTNGATPLENSRRTRCKSTIRVGKCIKISHFPTIFFVFSLLVIFSKMRGLIFFNSNKRPPHDYMSRDCLLVYC